MTQTAEDRLFKTIDANGAALQQASAEKHEEHRTLNAKKGAQLRAGAAVSLDELDTAPPPEFVIERLFVRDEAHLLVSESGKGKSTLALHIALNFALRRAVLAPRHKPKPRPDRPPRIAFVTAEDRKGQMLYRLKQMCDARGLSAEQRATIAESIVIIDVTEMMDIALTELSPLTKKRSMSDFALQLETALEGMDIVFFDPIGMFVGGAENSNDDIQVMLRFTRGMARRGNFAAVLIHHTSKASSIAESSQNVARGAYSWNANTRWFGHLQGFDGQPEKYLDAEWVAPNEAAWPGELGDQWMTILNHKASHMDLSDPPTLIRRRGWRLEVFDMVRRGEEQAVQQRLSDDEQRLAGWLEQVASRENSISMSDAVARRQEFGEAGRKSCMGKDSVKAAWARLHELKKLKMEVLRAPSGRGAPSPRCVGVAF